MAKFLPNVRISEIHGQPAWVKGRLIVPMFHPAAALHQPSLKTSVERDFSRLPEWIQQARTNERQTATRQANNLLVEAPAQEKTSPQTLQESAAMLFDPDALEQENKKEQEEPAQPVQKEGPTQLSLF
jgi:hypothetical protein